MTQVDYFAAFTEIVGPQSQQDVANSCPPTAVCFDNSEFWGNTITGEWTARIKSNGETIVVFDCAFERLREIKARGITGWPAISEEIARPIIADGIAIEAEPAEKEAAEEAEREEEEARARAEAEFNLEDEANPSPQTDDVTPETEDIAPQLNPRAINIPPALKPLAEQKRWIVWKWEKTKHGKPTKVPYRGLAPNRKASTTQSTTWCDLRTAMLAYTKGNADGIGYVLTDGNISAIDIDDCRNATTGELHPWAAEQVARSNSYVEVTPSNEGVRIIGLSNGGTDLNNRFVVPNTDVSGELYRRPGGRFITITGKQIGAATELKNIDAQIDMLISLLVTEPDTGSSDQVATENKWASFTLLPYKGSGSIPLAPEFINLPDEDLGEGLEGWLEQYEQWWRQTRDARPRMTAQELLNTNGIYLKNYNPGNHSRTCPKCLASRQPENKKKRCLSVKIDDKGARPKNIFTEEIRIFWLIS